jgi:hypothetical protein
MRMGKGFVNLRWLFRAARKFVWVEVVAKERGYQNVACGISANSVERIGTTGRASQQCHAMLLTMRKRIRSQKSLKTTLQLIY